MIHPPLQLPRDHAPKNNNNNSSRRTNGHFFSFYLFIMALTLLLMTVEKRKERLIFILENRGRREDMMDDSSSSSVSLSTGGNVEILFGFPCRACGSRKRERVCKFAADPVLRMIHICGAGCVIVVFWTCDRRKPIRRVTFGNRGRSARQTQHGEKRDLTVQQLLLLLPEQEDFLMRELKNHERSPPEAPDVISTSHVISAEWGERGVHYTPPRLCSTCCVFIAPAEAGRN